MTTAINVTDSNRDNIPDCKPDRFNGECGPSS